MSTGLCFTPASELARMIRQREVSPADVARAYLDRIEAIDGRLGAYITVLRDEVMAAARRAEKAVLVGDKPRPLQGVPVAVKDLLGTRGVRTTAGSRFFAAHALDEDSSAVERLAAAGAILLGKTNLDEFALSATTQNPHFGATRNPWDLERIPGGSSGGSGAAVAAGLAAAALGTDTGGSVRIPAAFCGAVGLKPTYGRVSCHGVVPVAWSLDHVGPLTRTVEDAALLLGLVAGHDPRDPTTSDRPVPDYRPGLAAGVKGLHIGLLRGAIEGSDAAVAGAVQHALGRLERLGASVDEVAVSGWGDAVVLEAGILLPEAAAYHERLLREHGDEYGADARLLLETGQVLLATHYVQAQRARRLLSAECLRVLGKLDAIVTPTVGEIAPRPEGCRLRFGDREVDTSGRFTRFTVPFNLTGLPAISIPCGLSPEGLPVGMQIVGRPFDEATVLRMAYAIEQEVGWSRQRPPL